MKNCLKVLVVMVGIIGMGLVSEVQAQNTASSAGQIEAREKTEVDQGEIEKIREAVKAKIKTVRENVASQQAGLKSRLSEQIQKRLKDLFGSMLKRQQAAVEKLENILERIETRLAKLNNEGRDVTKLKKMLVEAQDSLQKAKEVLEVTETEYANLVVDSENPREGLKALKSLVVDFKKYMNSTHSQIKLLVKQMKAVSESATPTMRSGV